MQIDQALEKFLNQLDADGRSIHTRAQYQRHIRLLARWVASDGRSCEVEDLDHEDLALFLTSSQARTRPDAAPKTATTMNSLRTSLRCFFGYAHAAGWIRENPARLIRRAQCGTPPPRALSEEEQRRLMSVLAAGEGRAARRDHALFHMMLATGVRLGSALAAEVGDVDLERSELRLRSTKGDRPEVVYLGRAIAEHLSRYIAEVGEGLLFPGQNGWQLTPRQAHRRFTMSLDRAGITSPVSPHSLRHAFATGLYRRTGDVLLVKEALRHRSVESTLVYARVDEGRLRAALGG